jgi:hypothetical protein
MPKQIAFKTVYTAMKEYKVRVAPDGTCDAWADFAEHTRKRLGQLPWNLLGSRQQAIRRLLDCRGGRRRRRL